MTPSHPPPNTPRAVTSRQNIVGPIVYNFLIVSFFPRTHVRTYVYPEVLRQYDNAMKEGQISLQISTSVLMGTAESGKSLTMAMITEEAPPPIERADSDDGGSDDDGPTPSSVPVRPVKQTRLCVKNGKVTRTDLREYCDILMTTIQDTARRLPGHLPVSPPREPRRYHSGGAPEYMRQLEKEMVRRVIQETHYEDLMQDMRWIMMTDCGGQPLFMEALSVFFHQVSLGVFFIKLNERLDGFPMIRFYDHLGCVMGDLEPQRSSFTHIQVLRQCMRALVTQRDTTKILFIGTHRDLEEMSVGESIADKNAKLHRMIRSFKMEENVVYYNENFDLIFPINAKTPSPKDWEVVGKVREVLVESSDVPAIQIPVSWFALELTLLRYVNETYLPVLLESKCFEMVSSFKFDRASLKAALRYLHRLKLIFYYEKKGIIVADTQLFLDILDDMAYFYYDLLQNPDMPIALEYKWNRFIRHGVFHSSCLEEYTNRYIPGVFTPEDALQMMVELNIFIDLGGTKKEYLMPCLLDGEEVAYTGPEPKSQALPPLVIEFPNGGPVLGTFYNLASRLSDQWGEILNRLGDPHNLCRNCIFFKPIGDFPGMVAVSDPISDFLLVSFHCNPELAIEICYKICRGMLMLIEETYRHLGYTCADPPRVTFLCPCKTTPIHPAVISSTQSYLTCPYGLPGFETVTPEHMQWLKGQ